MAALPESPLVSVEDYLNTAYDPDVEYVDGILVERALGDRLHSLLQIRIGHLLLQKYPTLKVYSEWRTRISQTRYRIPDVTVMLADPGTRYLLEAPWIAIEILSDGDSFTVIIEKLREYARMGASNIWLFDPHHRTMFVYREAALEEVGGGAISTADGAISLTRDEIFAE